MLFESAEGIYCIANVCFCGRRKGLEEVAMVRVFGGAGVVSWHG